MYLMYVDESGDTGLVNSPTRYFILSGLVFHELRWRQVLEDHVTFRRHLRNSKGLKLREEIHCTAFINSPGEIVRIRRNDRLDILKQVINWAASNHDLNVITVVVDKLGKTTDIFDIAWSALIQRFENTIRYRNFRGPANADDKGIILTDNTDGEKLIGLTRRIRKYNPIPNTRQMYIGGTRNIPVGYVIEDPILRNSVNSYFHQVLDVIAYMARQIYEPNNYVKKKGGNKFYYRLDPILVKQASRNNQWGIVEL